MLKEEEDELRVQLKKQGLLMKVNKNEVGSPTLHTSKIKQRTSGSPVRWDGERGD